jgi:hypothetical protein
MIEPVTSPTFSVYFGRGVYAFLLGYRYGELVEYLPKEIALPFRSLEGSGLPLTRAGRTSFGPRGLTCKSPHRPDRAKPREH